MKWCFIVFCIYIIALFFVDQRVPGGLVERVFESFAPSNLVLDVDGLSFGFRRGVQIRGVRLYDMDRADPTALLAGADRISIHPLSRRIVVDGAKYTRLPDSYYAPGNQEKNARVEGEFPELGVFHVLLTYPDILAVRPKSLTAEVEVSLHRIEFRNMHLEWSEPYKVPMTVDGRCTVDLDRQEVAGMVDGIALQSQIRPLLVAIDVPVALPYMDGFTEVPEPCKSRCEWKVDLIRNDLDLWLDLHPILGKYNEVPMKKADGRIHLHNYTRGNCLNYKTTVGPISAIDRSGRTLDGTVTITGTNNYNVVDVEATSFQPISDVLRIGGFTGDYVGNEAFGHSTCSLQFRFPRAMTNNYEVLNGRGSITVKDGQLMRMKGFRGLIDAMPSIAPAVTWFTDSTQASCDYVIENGILKSDNIYIEGSLFSIKMYGTFDTVREKLDFTVRVQFTKKDSLMGRLLHPLAWPFTKLLLEFRLTGRPEDPKWEYVSVIDRVLEVVK